MKDPVDNIACSVIICTHNRASSLVRTLQAVLEQDFQASDMEVIVVDNASTDDTKETVQSISQNALFPVKYLFEPTLGLSHARNAGLRQALGKIVVFTDDDALPRTQWIRNLTKAYDDPEIKAAGGYRPYLAQARAPSLASSILDRLSRTHPLSPLLLQRTSLSVLSVRRQHLLPSRNCHQTRCFLD